MMNVDCETCPVQGLRCEDCVITALFVPGSFELPMDAADTNAVAPFVRAAPMSD